MNSKNLSLIKNKLKKYLNNKDILDIIVFGSAVKGKALPGDIDIAVISKKEIKIPLQKFHIISLSPLDFISNPPSLIHTLLKEGYSLKKDKPFSEIFNFKNKTLFRYELSNLKPSKKVKIVNVLRGKNKQKGAVELNNGEWLANQVFMIPPEKEHFFEQFFLNFKIRFKKYSLLID